MSMAVETSLSGFLFSILSLFFFPCLFSLLSLFLSFSPTLIFLSVQVLCAVFCFVHTFGWSRTTNCLLRTGSVSFKGSPTPLMVCVRVCVGCDGGVCVLGASNYSLWVSNKHTTSQKSRTHAVTWAHVTNTSHVCNMYITNTPGVIIEKASLNHSLHLSTGQAGTSPGTVHHETMWRGNCKDYMWYKTFHNTFRNDTRWWRGLCGGYLRTTLTHTTHTVHNKQQTQHTSADVWCPWCRQPCWSGSSFRPLNGGVGKWHYGSGKNACMLVFVYVRVCFCVLHPCWCILWVRVSWCICVCVLVCVVHTRLSDVVFRPRSPSGDPVQHFLWQSGIIHSTMGSGDYVMSCSVIYKIHIESQ